MKSKVISEYFDLSDIFTLKYLNNISESEEVELLSKITSKEIDKVNELLKSDEFNKKIKSSKVYKDIKSSNNKVRKILEDTLEKIKSIEVDSNDKETMDKITFWCFVISQSIINAYSLSSPIISTVLISLIIIEITMFIVDFISISIFGKDLIRYSIIGSRVKEKLCKGKVFNSIQSLSNINKEDMKKINNSINSGKLNIVENFNYNNTLNELLYLPTRIINTLMEFTISVIRYPIYFIYSSRVSIDDYLQIQISFLENNIKNKKLDKDVKLKQQKWLNVFKSLSSKISVDFNKSSNDISTKIENGEKKKKISDINSDTYNTNGINDFMF